MTQTSSPKTGVRGKAVKGLYKALKHYNPNASFDKDDRVNHFCDNLVGHVACADFEDELRGGGIEFADKPGYDSPKFHAPHSSSALQVNCFAPFRTRLDKLIMPEGKTIKSLRFEAQCSAGVNRPPPRLDVLLSCPDRIIGIESKLLEPISGEKVADFKEVYDEIPDKCQKQGYFDEMQRLRSAPKDYKYLDAAQLIKHAFGLTNTYRGFPVTLLYLYWEPKNANKFPEFAEHRENIEKFAKQVAGSMPTFKAMSYPNLWAVWREAATGWVSEHLDNLEERYRVDI